jgi:hypothetical protein
MYQGRNMEQFEEDSGQVENSEIEVNDDSETNIVRRQIRRLYRKTKEDARRIFLKSKQSFKDFVSRW